MSTEIRIVWNPPGFAECLNGMDDMVKSVAEQQIAQRLQNGPGNYTVEVTHEPRFLDASYGVSRPVAVAKIIGDEAASIDEAENKTMSKAVW